MVHAIAIYSKWKKKVDKSTKVNQKAGHGQPIRAGECRRTTTLA